ncbi:MAG: carbon starvation protein A [Planctomycetota bacterium]|nr:MAG: carbon starvation protein A [Planctomycetota bacterium]RKY11854.1 MAG: carbon starvation protein A [Planctomycetota bacterium]
MDALFLMIVCFGGYVLAYHSYGKFLAKKIFNLRPDAPVPSRERNDGIDFVPTGKGIIFGHHFTSIAGTGPIVGPAIGIIWGWLPAILWVTLGSIFMGAVHDFGSLVVSLRNDGKSISEIAARYINKRVRLIFFIIVFLALLIVIAIFGIVIATVFKLYPESVLAVWLEIPIALILGWAIYKKRVNIKLATTAAVAMMYIGVFLGASLEHIRPGLMSFPADFAIGPTGLWTIILLGYAWIASTLPVTTLLQPRDYINAWQLAIMMALLAAGVVASALLGGGDFRIVAPAINSVGADIPPLMPMMFVTIACGAISGFHSLVAGGTSSKQIIAEPDAQFVGYGSMLTEGALAVLVILCICAGLGMGHDGQTGSAVWQGFYGSWMGAKGLGDKLQPVVVGASNMMGSLGIPKTLGLAIMGVFIASFAGTTLDTAVRIQRYIVGELAEDMKLPQLSNRWAATTIAVITAAALAFINTQDGKITFGANALGAMRLWPLFGTVNQLLAALALLVVTMYLKRAGGLNYLISGIPCVLMLIVTGWAMILNEQKFWADKNILLIVIGGVVFLLAVWMMVETLILFCRPKTCSPYMT